MIWVCFNLVLCVFFLAWLDFHIQFREGIGGSAHVRKQGPRSGCSWNWSLTSWDIFVIIFPLWDLQIVSFLKKSRSRNLLWSPRPNVWQIAPLRQVIDKLDFNYQGTLIAWGTGAGPTCHPWRTAQILGRKGGKQRPDPGIHRKS